MKQSCNFKHARRLHPSQTQRGDVADSREGEPGYGAAVDRDFPGAWDHGVAAESCAVREAGFCVSRGAGDGVCGWVFLAWLSGAWDEAEKQCGVLAQEDQAEQGAGCGGVPGSAEEGVEGLTRVGT